MKLTINSIIKIISVTLLLSLILATVWFTYGQITSSKMLDEALVSDLTTQLETRLIDQAINKVAPPTVDQPI